jgi:hypothetical protein
MDRVHAVLPLVLAALLGGCSGGDERAIAESKLPTLVLQPGDLSKVWQQFDEGKQVRADAPSGRRADPTRFDRKGGWKARYRRAGTPATPGPLVIESRADLFGDSDGAKKDFGTLADDLDAGLGGPVKRLEAPELGEEAVAAEALQGTGPAAVRFYSVAWRQDNVVAAMLVNGFARSLTFDDLLDLARKQQARIQRAADR